MTIYLVLKVTAIVHATPTNTRPTPSAWNHERDRLSNFVPIASLVEWQWCQIVMRNGKFYHPSRNGASPMLRNPTEPFYTVLQAQVGQPTPHPPRAGSSHCEALCKPLNAGPFSTKNFLCVNCMYSTSTIYLCILVHVYLHAGIHTFFGKFAL